MNDLPRKILYEIIRQNGTTYFEEKDYKFRNLLNDLCYGSHKKERRCITDSISEGIPSALIDRSKTVSYEILSAQLTDRLINCGFESQLARWTVDSWAQALGIISPQINTGSLLVVANPPEAKVFLNDKLVGITPFELSNLSVGNYDLKIILDGYQIWQKRVDIPAGQKITINANLAKPISFGELLIDSSPTGAVIFIDSQHHGATPKKIREIPPGNHQISLTLPGYEKFSKNVTVKTGQNPDLTVRLRSVEPPQPGQIAIDSIPSNAEIYFDSKYQGKTPKILTGISAGNHNVTIKLNGHPSFSTNTIISQGKNPDIFWEFPRHPKEELVSPSSTRLIKNISIGLISIAAIYFVLVPLLAPFLGLIATPLKINVTPPTIIAAATQNPDSSGIFLPTSGTSTGSIGGDVTKTYYFDVVNYEKIRFIRITIEGDQFTDYDFIIGKEYVPSFTPPHYDIISNIGLLSEEYDIQNPSNSRYYVVIKNKGNSGGYTISKTIFYNS